MQLVINQRRQERQFKSMTLATKPTIRGLMSGRSMWKDISFHAACVLQGRIFVFGCYSSVRKVKETIGCYAPNSTAGKTERESVLHAVVGLQIGLWHIRWSILGGCVYLCFIFFFFLVPI